MKQTNPFARKRHDKNKVCKECQATTTANDIMENHIIWCSCQLKPLNKLK